MKFFKCNNVVEVLQPIIVTCRILGLFPFPINEKRFKVTLIFMVWTNLWVLFFILLTVVACQKIAYGTLYSIKYKSQRVIDILTYVTSLICIISGIVFRNKIRIIIKYIEKLDRQLKSEGLVDNIENSYSRNLVLCYMCNFVVFISCTAVGLLYFYSCEDISLLFCPFLPLWYTQLQFCSIVYLIWERFSWLNIKLSNVPKKLYLPVSPNTKVAVISPIISSSFLQERVLELIQSARLKHYQLCEISEQLNVAYSFQLLLLLLNHFLRIIHILYYQSKRTFDDSLLADISSLVHAVASVIVVTIACSKTAGEAKRTSCVVHELLPCDARKLQLCRKEVKCEVLRFSLQLLHQTISFSPCNMFPIDETLFLRMLSSLTTYLVIVIQFDISLRGPP